MTGTIWTPENIKALRAKLGGISQDDLARKCEVTTDAVRSWETGRRNPSRLARKILDSLRPSLMISIINPWTGSWVHRDIADLTDEQLMGYAVLMDQDLREELHAGLAPCTPGEFLAAWVQRVGPDEAGIVILGGIITHRTEHPLPARQ